MQIGDDRFSDCTKLAYEIADGGKYLGKRFMSRANTTDTAITVREGTTGIYFMDGSNLKTSHLPASLLRLREDSFLDMDLYTITVGEENAAYVSSGNCLIDLEAKRLIRGCKNTTIPTDGSVEIIAKHAFHGAESLTRLVIPSSVTSIGEDVFSRFSHSVVTTTPVMYCEHASRPATWAWDWADTGTFKLDESYRVKWGATL